MAVAEREEAALKLTAAKLPRELADKWDKVTMERGLNKSAVIRMLIEKYLEEAGVTLSA